MLERLSAPIAERARLLNDADAFAGDYVLYWMHHAVRDHDNPALDAAIELANGLGQPLLIYMGLAGRHDYNSDRHHYFILQGVRDAARALARRGLSLQCHWPQNSTDTALAQLLSNASASVFECMPVSPFNRWHPILARKAPGTVIEVDARCIVPMTLSRRAPDRAFKFRSKFADDYVQRIAAGWPDTTTLNTSNASQSVFEPVDLTQLDDAALLARIARTDIDHSIGPVAHTPGGSSAGYARWQAFVNNGLKHYHRRRNDAADQWSQGVSRMSGYLHHGHVSAFRLAQEAQAAGGGGAAKFIEELTIWRELAHHFCFFCKDPDALTALPQWAQDTLAQHAHDARPELVPLHQLQRAQSPDALWNLAQKSLMVHGELHNNLRMTWAKALLSWSASPSQALSTLLDLNHRYALDGNDPSSYGGLLWALGLFDRPFEPAQPVFGSVRGRSLEAHAKRLDMPRYAAQVQTPAGRRLRIAIIGAGISGLAAAGTLMDHQHEVVVFEKSRGPGGRAATRRRDALRFNHGAQFFTARDPRIARHLPSLMHAGVVQAWPTTVAKGRAESLAIENSDTRYRAIPGMNRLARTLAGPIDIITQARVLGLQPGENRRWCITLKAPQTPPGGLEFDAVIVSAPAPQAAELLTDIGTPLGEVARSAHYTPCWALMFETHSGQPPAWQAAFLDDPTIAWLAHDAGTHDQHHRWVAHASTHWSEQYLELTADAAAAELSNAINALNIEGLEAISSTTAHRWRFARVTSDAIAQPQFDVQQMIGICGDWCAGASRVEAAWLSGVAVAGEVLANAALHTDDD
ncbi:MAG: NAD(P)-binding protein [Pseudomonadota bacterium]